MFIHSDKIERILETTRMPLWSDVEGALQKSLTLSGLGPEEAALLIRYGEKEPDFQKELCRAAMRVKEKVYGKRLVLFAPLYLSNICINSCLYCGFRKENRGAQRKVLGDAEIRAETKALLRDGHKRLLLVAGEGPPDTGMEYIEKAIDLIYSIRTPSGSIRRLNVNIAPLPLEGFLRLKAKGIGTYQLFQETYHPETYAKVHPAGPKRDYLLRLNAIDLAQEAGIDDVGIGALFGLYDYGFELLSLLCHAEHLQKRFGVGPHTISVPRIEPAPGSPFSFNPISRVTDDEFRLIIAVLRLAVPYTGIILSTREKPGLRNELLSIGVSQISANSRTIPGGYSIAERHGSAPDAAAQFILGDRRSTADVVKDVSGLGFTPSFCTACYRTGRTGQTFMGYARPGRIQRFCRANAILTFKEYMLDFGSEELKESGDKIINDELESIEDAELRVATIDRLKRMEEDGKRDLFF